MPALANEPQTTFFRHNAQQKTPPLAARRAGKHWPSYFNWLVHLDRQVTSPLELLHVSAYPPYQLTQSFSTLNRRFPPPMGTHQCRPGSIDQRRIYRALEFFDAGIRATAVDPYGQVIPLTGRIPGRININEIWDKKQLRALCDPQTGLSTFTQAQVDQIFTMIMNSRTPKGIPIANRSSLQGHGGWQSGLRQRHRRHVFASGGRRSLESRREPRPAQQPGEYPAARHSESNRDASEESPQTPPSNYVQMELMNKIFNNVTCQSNVFAIWLTVGFFDVTDGPVTIATTIPSAKSITVPAVTGTQSGCLGSSKRGAASGSITNPCRLRA